MAVGRRRKPTVKYGKYGKYEYEDPYKRDRFTEYFIPRSFRDPDRTLTNRDMSRSVDRFYRASMVLATGFRIVSQILRSR